MASTLLSHEVQRSLATDHSLPHGVHHSNMCRQSNNCLRSHVCSDIQLFGCAEHDVHFDTRRGESSGRSLQIIATRKGACTHTSLRSFPLAGTPVRPPNCLSALTATVCPPDRHQIQRHDQEAHTRFRFGCSVEMPDLDPHNLDRHTPTSKVL